MPCLSAKANYAKEDVTITANLVREAVVASAHITCSIGVDNSLHAADGVLYDSNYTPIFTTE